MRAALFAVGVAVGACSVPHLEDVGRANDAGSCSVAVWPASCEEVAEHVDEIRGALPCNEHGGYWTCAVYRCECEIRSVCKECEPRRMKGGTP